MTDDVKVKVESLLFLVEKFEVSGQFALEMAIVLENLPIYYHTSRNQSTRLTTIVYIYICPISCSFLCVQVSFKEKLAYELNSLVCYSHDVKRNSLNNIRLPRGCIRGREIID